MGDFEKYNAIFEYHPDDGTFYWKVSPKRSTKIGSLAGGLGSKGYISLMYERKPICAHRMAWLLTYGRWPDGEIDHINGIRDDNRLCNLRDVPRRVNCTNKKCHREGHSVGVSFRPAKGNRRTAKWEAHIGIDGIYYFLGSYGAKAEAEAAYQKAQASVLDNPARVPSYEIRGRGCSYRKDIKKWCAYIRLNDKMVHLGVYDTEEAAHAVYLKEKVKQLKLEGKLPLDYKEAE